jgi:hypothetical protein
MSTPSNNYVKLPGVGHQLGSYTRLYRSGDHLLQVSSVTFSEHYKRFYFRDIQAFIVVRTNWWMISTIVLMALTLLLIGIAVSVNDPVTAIFPAGLAGIFFLTMLVNGVRGPTCRCYVRTAVQTEKLPSLNRLRRTEKVLAELKPLLDAAQGPMPPVEAAIPVTPVSEPLPTAGTLPPASSAS